MDFLKKAPFSIITEENTDYSDGVNTNVREAFPTKTYLLDALSSIHGKYPQYSTLKAALRYAKQLLEEEKTVIAVSVLEIKDHFKLHVKSSNKYEHMNVAYSRVAHGMKRKHTCTLVRKVPPTYKTTQDLIEHVGYVVGDMVNGYINISLILNIMFGGSFIFNIILLTAYHGYMKTLVVKYYSKLIIIVKQRMVTPSLPSHTGPTVLLDPVVFSESSEDGDSTPIHFEAPLDEKVLTDSNVHDPAM